MKKIKIDRKAIRFSINNYGVNAFWADLFGQRGCKFFMRQLLKGIKAILRK